MTNLTNWKESTPATIRRGRKNPFLSLQTELDRAMEDFHNTLDFSGPYLRNFKDFVIHPPIDIIEDEHCFKVETEMPGLCEDNIKIEISDGRLIIKGEKSVSKKNEDKNYISREINYGSYERVIALPDTVDIDKVNASFKKGMLWVTIPKKKGTSQHSRVVKVEKAAD